jgi:hypothetical protein
MIDRELQYSNITKITLRGNITEYLSLESEKP